MSTAASRCPPSGCFLLRRVGKAVAAAAAINVVSLALGMLGYHLTEGMDRLDAFLNASMLLGGMGSVDTLHSATGKSFAGVHAPCSSLVRLGAAGLPLAPFVHRLLHWIHLPEGRREGQG